VANEFHMPVDDSQSIEFQGEPYVHPSNHPIVTEFRENQGKVGGSLAEVDLLLLTTLGARSQRPQTAPLTYFRDGGRYLVVGSAASSPRHPGWYHNLRANPIAQAEIGVDNLRVHAVIIEGGERDALFAEILTKAPAYANYQIRARRHLPVVALVPTAG
jgi:deazaflavin-dependent oxidoreductase (nitroreductase family)